MSTPEIAARAATLVPEDRRRDFLPSLFGLRHLILAENLLYTLMNRLSPQDYGGGFWDFYEFKGKPLYLVPTSKPRYRIRCDTNGYEGEVSADAAGIIATLFTFSHLSFHIQSDLPAEGFSRLYPYAAEHPEAGEIFQAID